MLWIHLISEYLFELFQLQILLVVLIVKLID